MTRARFVLPLLIAMVLSGGSIVRASETPGHMGIKGSGIGFTIPSGKGASGTIY